MPFKRTFLPWLPTLLAALLGGAAVLVSHTRGPLVHVEWLPSLLWLGPAILMAAWWRRFRGPAADSPGVPEEVYPALALLFFLVLYLYSSATADRWFYFLNWFQGAGLRSRLFGSLPAQFMMWTALLTPLFLVGTKRPWLVLLSVLILCQAASLYYLLSVSGGEALYRDDHPSFMLRLWVFAKTFPGLIYYNPLWNGGRAASYLVASGTTSLGALLWPVWKFGSISQVYTPALGLLFIVVIPGVAAASLRVIGGSGTASMAAAVLALGISQHFFLWVLHYGTVGATTASAFIMLASACLYRILWRDHKELWVSLLLVLSAFLFLSWPAHVLLLSPVFFGILASGRQWTGGKMLVLVLCAAALAALCVPLVMIILRYADLGGFAQAHLEPFDAVLALKKGWRTFRSHLVQSHPLLLFLGLGGVWFLKRPGIRSFYGVTMVALALVAGWGEGWKPQFQLKRAGIPLFFLAVTPAGLWLGWFLENRTVWLAPVRAALVVLLLLGGLNVAEIYGNGGRARYRTINAETRDLIEWIKDETPPDGRILFAGPTVHAYGGGHVAFLPVLAGREMMASDYYHFSTKTTEYEYPPRSFRRPDARVYEFMELYNVTHIVTYHGRWMKFFRKYPDQYEEVRNFGVKRKKSIFKVTRTPSWFLRGSGTVESDINLLRVHADAPDRELVLKYHWVEGLTADGPVELRPHEVEENVTFIAVHPRGTEDFSIRFRKWM
jgi:hypothetical protein